MEDRFVKQGGFMEITTAIYVFCFILIVFVVYKKSIFNKSPHKASGNLVVDGSGEIVLRLLFTPKRCAVVFSGRVLNVNQIKDDNDLLFARPAHKGIRIIWKTHGNREVSWRCEG